MKLTSYLNLEKYFFAQCDSHGCIFNAWSWLTIISANFQVGQNTEVFWGYFLSFPQNMFSYEGFDQISFNEWNEN